MAELTRTERTSHEVTGLRADAERMLSYSSVRESPYMAARVTAVLDTCDWLVGDRELSPATESPVRPDGRGRKLERMRGEDLERERRAVGDSTGATRAGVVAQTVLWFDLDPFTDAPL